jgi:hypothetical protein
MKMEENYDEEGEDKENGERETFEENGRCDGGEVDEEK